MAHARGAVINPFLVRQAIAALVGFAAMFAVMHVDYRWLKKPQVVYTLLAGVVVLLVAVLFAPELNATRRWLFIAGVSVQPSELAKLALVPFLAYQIDRKRDRVNSRELLVPIAAASALLAGLIVAAARPRVGGAAGRDRRDAALPRRPLLALARDRGRDPGAARGAADLPRALPPGAPVRLPRPGEGSARQRLPGAAVADRDRLRGRHRPGAGRERAEALLPARIRTRTSSSPSSPRSSA